MTLTTAQIAIAKLIELAETGEINPWDVQVIEVIDRFLRELTDSEMDLPQSGQAFLWASMLVLLKANSLSHLTEEPTPEESLSDLESLPPKLAKHPLFLEQQLKRRSAAPPLKKRRVTLPELIAQIQAIAKQLEKIPPLVRSRPSRSSLAKTITHLAHQENLTEVANLVEQFFLYHLPPSALECLELEQLLDLLAQNICQEDGQNFPSHDRVGVFWALLLLSAESKVELSQKEFYQDLQIKPLLTG